MTARQMLADVERRGGSWRLLLPAQAGKWWIGSVIRRHSQVP